MFDPLIELKPIHASRTDQDRFHSGELPLVWAERYPSLFDEHCLSNAIRQPGIHFAEWFTAIWFFENKGLLSLNQQYRFDKHQRKRAVIKELADEIMLAAIADSRSVCASGAEPPDLVVYSTDHSFWFFCEVKKRDGAYRDTIKPNQQDYFSALARLRGAPVLVQPVVISLDQSRSSL